ncbi:MAG: hypothetical protein LBG79_00435 [Spirochaetaceae bacterium]|nr:hypothetical protein [Spirochaetaceae bacterium]
MNGNKKASGISGYSARCGFGVIVLAITAIIISGCGSSPQVLTQLTQEEGWMPDISPENTAFINVFSNTVRIISVGNMKVPEGDWNNMTVPANQELAVTVEYKFSGLVYDGKYNIYSGRTIFISPKLTPGKKYYLDAFENSLIFGLGRPAKFGPCFVLKEERETEKNGKIHRKMYWIRQQLIKQGRGLQIGEIIDKA